jgi:phosphatidylserine/phosphatidylglycerophosphate/cardiolipin synthase-like enzyme
MLGGLVVACLILALGFVHVSRQWDKRVELGFPVGQRSVPVLPAPTGPPASAPASDSIDVYFSPNGGATEAIVLELGRAKQRVRVLAYSFTSAPIAKALVDAKGRGVAVTVVLDDSQRTEGYSSATFLHHHGVPVFIARSRTTAATTSY